MKMEVYFYKCDKCGKVVDKDFALLCPDCGSQFWAAYYVVEDGEKKDNTP